MGVKLTKDEREFFERAYLNFQQNKHLIIDNLDGDPMMPTLRERRHYASHRALDRLLADLAYFLHPKFDVDAWYSNAWEEWLPAKVRNVLRKHRYGSYWAEDAIEEGLKRRRAEGDVQ